MTQALLIAALKRIAAEDVGGYYAKIAETALEAASAETKVLGYAVLDKNDKVAGLDSQVDESDIAAMAFIEPWAAPHRIAVLVESPRLRPLDDYLAECEADPELAESIAAAERDSEQPATFTEIGRWSPEGRWTPTALSRSTPPEGDSGAAPAINVTGVGRTAPAGEMDPRLLPAFLRGVADGLRQGIADARDASGIDQAAAAFSRSTPAALTDEQIAEIWTLTHAHEPKWQEPVLVFARAVIEAVRGETASMQQPA
jgi:hypothetical protein